MSVENRENLLNMQFKTSSHPLASLSAASFLSGGRTDLNRELLVLFPRNSEASLLTDWTRFTRVSSCVVFRAQGFSGYIT